MPNKSVIDEIAEIELAIEFLRDDKKPREQNVWLLDKLPQYLRKIVGNNSNINDKRKKVLNFLLKKVRIYRDEMKIRNIVAKEECYSILFTVKNLYRYEFNDVRDLRDEIISEIKTIFN